MIESAAPLLWWTAPSGNAVVSRQSFCFGIRLAQGIPPASFCAASCTHPKESAMPTYEYACPTCGIVEAFQSIKEPALTKCPSCKKAKVQRMISSGAGIIFKGSGFWETDYNRGGDYAKKQKADAALATGKPTDKPTDKPSDKPTKPLTTTPAGGAGAAAGDVAPKAKAQTKPLAIAKAGDAS